MIPRHTSERNLQFAPLTISTMGSLMCWFTAACKSVVIEPFTRSEVSSTFKKILCRRASQSRMYVTKSGKEQSTRRNVPVPSAPTQDCVPQVRDAIPVVAPGAGIVPVVSGGVVRGSQADPATSKTSQRQGVPVERVAFLSATAEIALHELCVAP